ncbi:MAG: TonB-dependent receptor [Alphaproteobacteria bacterium]|nr:TonB-dependent receptor [Alphaproteobacteria bacterium]
MLRKHLFSSACAVAGILVATGAHAASDEIIVQARKRSETLDTIPVTGSAVGTQAIQDFGGFVDNYNLADFLTGVSVDPAGNPEFFVRGAGVGRIPTSDSATTQLRNGAETSGGFNGRAFFPIDLFDMQQIEVYRGPQGALYGRNAVGGVINVVNQRAKSSYGYSFLVDHGFQNESTRVEGVVNLPLGEKLAIRLGGIGQARDGQIDNEYLDRSADWDDYGGGRVALRAEFTDWLEANLMVDYFEEQFGLGYDELNGFVPPLAIGAGTVDPDGNPVSGTTSRFPLSGEIDKQAYDTASRGEEHIFNVNFQLDADFDWAKGSSITSFRKRDTWRIQDSEASYIGGFGTTAGCVTATGVVNMQCEAERFGETEIWTQELRLVSPDTGPLTWLLGTDYRHQDLPFAIFQHGFTPTVTMLQNYILMTNTTTDQAGFFGNLTYNVFDDFNVSGSLRYSVERKHYSQIRVANQAVNAALAMNLVPIDETNWYHFLNPSLSLSYKFPDRTLVYASWAQANRSGGFNTDDPTLIEQNTGQDVCPTEDCLRFDQESANTYEIGLKGRVFEDHSYAIAAYYTEYDDILVNASVPAMVAGYAVPFVDNLGDKAHIHGVETEINGRFRDAFGQGGRLSYSVGATFQEGAIDKVKAGVTTISDGVSLSRVPKWIINGNLSYRQPFPFLENTGLGLFVSSNFRWETGGLISQINPAIPRRDTIQRLNAKAGVEGDFEGQRWQLVGYMDNVLDLEYQTDRNSHSPNFDYATNNPVVVGLRLTVYGGGERGGE